MTQKALQWKFTACQYNIENANGFKTYSMSEGLTQEDKEDLIRFAGAYSRPEYLPDRPTADELALFPVSLISFLLRSGKRAVVRTSYVGQDYAGVRWGNFFSHGLILPSGYWGFHPIQLWDSPLFANGLLPEEQNIGRTPDPLPAVEIGDDSLYDWWGELNGFFAEESRREILGKLLAAVRSSRQMGKNVLLRDQGDNLPLWIAAVQYLFPPQWSQELQFSTYVHSVANARLLQFSGDIPDGTVVSTALQTAGNSFGIFDLTTEKVPVCEPDRWARFIDFDAHDYPGQKMNKRLENLNSWSCSIFDRSPEALYELLSFIDESAVEQQENADSLGNIQMSAKALEPRIQAAFDYLKTQSAERRLQTLAMLSKPNPHKIRDVAALKALLPLLLDSVLENKTEKNRDQIQSFIVKQYLVKPEDAGRMAEGYFSVLENLFNTDSPGRREFGLDLLERLKRSGRQDILFLEFSLILLLKSDKDKPEELELFKSQRLKMLSAYTADNFLLAVLPSAIKYSTTRMMYKSLIGLFSRRSEKMYKIFISYLLPYRSNPFNSGYAGKPQVNAFLQYLLKSEFQTDPQKDREAERLRTEVYNGFRALDEKSLPLIWKLFFLQFGAKPQQRKTVYDQISRNIGKMDELMAKRLRNILWLKTGWEGFSSWMGECSKIFREKWQFVLLFTLTVVIVALTVAVGFKVLQQKRPAIQQKTTNTNSANPESAKPDPKKQDKAKQKTKKDNKAKSKPAKTDPAKTDPAKTDPAKTDPAKTDPAKTDPAKTDPAKTDPAKTDPAKTDPAKTDPAKTDPAKTDPAKTDPAKTDPAKTDPAKTDTEKNRTR